MGVVYLSKHVRLVHDHGQFEQVNRFSSILKNSCWNPAVQNATAIFCVLLQYITKISFINEPAKW